ncbi:cytochrome P450 [Xylaria scruposa]|nr:cytochrome P450 [Xylaria scruposa]
MSWLVASTTLACFGISGILSHRLFFIQGEHHLRAPKYLATWMAVTFAMIVVLFASNHISIFRSVISVHCAFFVPLLMSILVYRVFQHPLREFDGPRLASVSKLWHLAYMFKSSNHLFLHRLIEKYGDIVRTGPQELTIADPGIWFVLGGRESPCIKAPWYDMLWPYVSLNSIRGRDGYRTRRKLWDEALRLPTAYLPDDGSHIAEIAAILVEQIQTSIGQVVNARALFSNYSFDVLGEVAFGRSFSLLNGTDLGTSVGSRDASTLIAEGMSMLRFFTPVPWAARLCIVLAPYLPTVARKWNQALHWTAEICDKRLEREGEINQRADAFSRFIRAARTVDDEKSLDRLALYGDAFSITVAGTHTVAATLTMLFFELAHHPEAQQQAREEILSIQHLREIHHKAADSSLETYPFLDACINETLRLYPAVPTGGIRQTLERGVHVNGRWIPPYTVIVAPRWTIGRLESAFDMPDKFLPERWTSKRHLIKDSRAFNAFGTGQHICPGKQLGLAEVRLVAIKLLLHFKFDFPPTQTSASRTVSEMQDVFTLAPGDLELVFTLLPMPV